MASTQDVKDMLGMSSNPVTKPVKKKKKLIETQPRLSGISREVQALMGDSVPPVAIIDTPKYKSKPSIAAKLFKPRHWEELSYTPAARSDGLQIKHWKRSLPHRDDSDTSQYEDDFPMEKWDISIKIPEYTDDSYKNFISQDWSREETDYLMRLADEYDLRWVLIADRYDPNEITGEQQYPQRTMEGLKQRYYQIAAADLELRTPKSNMNPQEFALYEKMRTFDAKTETARKAMAEKLFERTKDEAEEERTLLEELYWITKNEEEFIAMRRDLYVRLESAPVLRRNEDQAYLMSSAGLGDLLNRLTSKDRALRRRAMPEATAVERQRPIAGRRDTLETPVEKKTAPTPKNLSKAEEERYGVSHPTERLTSGVSFRHEKINRITTAKSQVQTQKLNAALTELGIPARLTMPTEKVCKEFERLVAQIQLLLDARKTLTRVGEEVKVLEEMKRVRLGEPSKDQTLVDTNTQLPEGQQNGEMPNTQGVDKSVINEEDDDAEGENDIEMSKAESQLDETRLDESIAHTQSDDEDDEDAENEAVDVAVEDDDAEGEDDDDDGEEEDEDDDEGTRALRRGARNEDDDDDDDDDAEAEAEDQDSDADADEDEDEEDEEEEQENQESSIQPQPENDSDEEDVTMDQVESAAGDPDMAEGDVVNSRPTSSGSRAHKRGASVVSDASGIGSNRSGAGRKRKR